METFGSHMDDTEVGYSYANSGREMSWIHNNERKLSLVVIILCAWWANKCLPRKRNSDLKTLNSAQITGPELFLSFQAFGNWVILFFL